MPLVSSSVEDSAFSSPVKDQAIEEEQLVSRSPHLTTVVQRDPGPPLHRPFTQLDSVRVTLLSDDGTDSVGRNCLVSLSGSFPVVPIPAPLDACLDGPLH
eukprot:gene10328-13259_t